MDGSTATFEKWVLLVWRIVNRMAEPHEDRNELFSAGAEALMSAIRNWNADDGRASFKTYAWKAIAMRILRWRKDEYASRRVLKIGRSKNRKVAFFSEIGTSFVRGSNPIFASEVGVDGPDYPPLGDLLSCLEPREKAVIMLRFGIGGDERKTFKQVGVEFGMSKERVRQIEARAIRRIRDHLPPGGEP